MSRREESLNYFQSHKFLSSCSTKSAVSRGSTAVHLFSMALSVGATVAVFEAALILSMSAFDLAVQKVLKTFADSRSATDKKVPHLHGKDTSPLLLLRTVFKFRKFPDAIAGLGVQASNQCDPVSVNGMVTASGFNRFSDILKMSRVIGSISQLSAVTFLDSPLSIVPQFFPKDLSPSICTKCISDEDAILSNCVVEEEPPIGPGELDITFGKTEGVLQTAVRKVGNRTDPAIQFYGHGDLIVDQFNFESCTMFYFGSEQGGDVLSSKMQLEYFEYNNHRKCRDALNRANSNPGEDFTMTSDDPVTVQKITCDRTLLNDEEISLAMVLHRTFEYEITLNRNRSDLRLPGLRPLNSSDPILAVLAYILAIGSPEPGSYRVYSACGKYDWRFISPFFGVTAFLLVLLLISQISRKNRKQDLEYGFGARKSDHMSNMEDQKFEDSSVAYAEPSREDDDDSSQ